LDGLIELQPAKETPKLPWKLRLISFWSGGRLRTGPGDRSSGCIDLRKKFQVVANKQREQKGLEPVNASSVRLARII
jgi:hypothetical protein